MQCLSNLAAMRHPSLKKKKAMNLLSQGMTASTEISILRNNSSIEKSSQSIARFLKKADYRTVSYFEQTEQRCIYTGKEKEKDEPKC